MASKNAGEIKQKSPARQIVVHSHTYGEHTRAARGSIQPAVLNDALVAKAKQLVTINALASAVHSLFKLHAGSFKESMLWQKMLSLMHSAPDITPVALLNSLTGLELNSRYPLRRFGSMIFTTVTLQKSLMTVQLKSDHTLHFNHKAAAYRFDIIVLFFNAKGKAAGDVLVSSKWYKVNEVAGTLLYDVAVPKSSKLYILCLRLHAGKDDEPLNELSSQGMGVVKAGTA